MGGFLGTDDPKTRGFAWSPETPTPSFAISQQGDALYTDRVLTTLADPA